MHEGHPAEVDGGGGGGVVGGDVGRGAAAEARIGRLQRGGRRLAHGPKSMERSPMVNLDIRHSTPAVLQNALRSKE